MTTMDDNVTSRFSDDNMSLTSQVMSHANVVRTAFYLVTPNETTFETLEQVPNFFVNALPYLPMMVFFESILLWLQGKSLPRFTDTMCSLCCALLLFLPVAVVGQVELGLYAYCYDKFHIIDLPWNSPVTWVLCLLAADLGFYVWHRAAHEINFIWAYHQVHHTSQDFNITVGVRLPSLNRYVAILFYLPAALFFPTPVFYAHYQLNYLYQFWIHSNTIPSLGWLDYILNTPSLHRVHHGRNRYCIDKNYGAVFSFWDVLFGTFQLEKPNEPIYYGLVHSINSFDPLYIQVHHLKHLFTGVKQQQGLVNKISMFVKGPGWAPSLPRLGNINDIPQIPEDKELYDVYLSGWLKLYLVIHWVVAFVIFNKIKVSRIVCSSAVVWFQAGYIVWSVASIGSLLELKHYGALLEVTRCAAYMLLEAALGSVLTSNPYFMYSLRTLFITSTIIWITHLRNRTIASNNKQLDDHLHSNGPTKKTD